MIKGLQGAASRDATGDVSPQDLAVFEREVPQYAENKQKVSQNPEFVITSSFGNQPILLKDADSHPLYAIVIGVSKYKSAAQSLQYSKNDAEAFSSLLKSRGAKVTTLIDTTRAQVLESLEQLAGNAKSDSTLILFFLGRSFLDRDGRAQLVMADSDISRPYTMLGLDEVKEMLARIPIDRQGVFLDSCFSNDTYTAYAPGPK